MGPRYTWIFFVLDRTHGFSPDAVDVGSEYCVVYLPSYLLFCCIYFDAWCMTCCPKTRRNSGSLHRVIGEVLVLGLLVMVNKIPHSSYIFSTEVVLEPSTMVWAYHTAVYLVHRSPPAIFLMVSPDVVDNGSEYFVFSLSCVCIHTKYIYTYIYIYMFSWLCRLVTPSYLLICCIYFDAWRITCCPKRGETQEVYTE